MEIVVMVRVIRSIKDKNMQLSHIFLHPIIQVLSFSVILVGSPHFGGPYVFFLYRGGIEGYLYALLGLLAIIVTIISCFLVKAKRAAIQSLGTFLMVASLVVFFFSSTNFMNMYAFRDLLPLVTLLVFFLIAIAVIRQFFKTVL